VFFGAPDQESFLRELLGLPLDVVPIGIVAIGRPAPDPRAGETRERIAQRRKPDAQLLHWERWSPS
jgi:nitroreductase